MNHKPGDIVIWTSSYTTKTGTVVARVPKGTDVRRYMPEGLRVANTQISNQTSIHDRYLVKVVLEGKKFPRYYAPMASVVDRCMTDVKEGNLP